MYERFTDRARKVMQLANQEAQRFNHEYIGTEHILLGLVKEGSGVAANVLKNLDIDLLKIHLELEKIVQSGPHAVGTGTLPQTPRTKKVIEYAHEEAKGLNHNYIGTEHLLLGLLREEEGVAAQVLLNLGLRLRDVRAEVLNLLGHNLEADPGPGVHGMATPALDNWGRDLTERARRGELDPVIGRRAVIEQVLAVLGCRERNNPLLVGAPGVGKTALLHALAQLSAAADPPSVLRDHRLVALYPVRLSLVARDSQEFQRITQAVGSEARRAKDAVLVLDDCQTFFGRRGFQADRYLGDVLRAAPAPDLLRCVATTRPRAYRACLAWGARWGSGFEPVFVPPSSTEEALEILQGVRGLYEAHHRVRIDDAALQAIVDLADRQLPRLAFPGKAVRVLDRAGALVRLRNVRRPPDLTELDTQLQRLNQEKERALGSQKFRLAAELRDQADKLQRQKENMVREWQQQAQEVAGVVTADTVAEVIHQMAGLLPS